MFIISEAVYVGGLNTGDNVKYYILNRSKDGKSEQIEPVEMYGPPRPNPIIAPRQVRPPKDLTVKDIARVRERAYTGNRDPIKNAVVVGGGPGGLAAAIKLAEKGVKVTVVEIRDANYSRPHQLNARQNTLDSFADYGIYNDVKEASGWSYEQEDGFNIAPVPGRAGRGHNEPATLLYSPSVAQVRISDVERALYKRAKELGINYLSGMQAHFGPKDENEMHSLSLEPVEMQDGRPVAVGPAESIGTPDLVIVADGAGSPSRGELGIEFKELSDKTYYLGGQINKALGPEYRKMVLLDGEKALHLMGTGHAKYPQTWVSVQADSSVSEMSKEERVELFCRRSSQLMGQEIKPEDITWGAGQTTVVQNRAAETAVSGNNVVMIGDAARTGSVWVSGGLNLALTTDVQALMKLVDGVNHNGYAREMAMSAYNARLQLATRQWHQAGSLELPPSN